jgi:hypothetical protein
MTQGQGSHHTPPHLHELYRLLSGDVRGFIIEQYKLLLQAGPSAKMLLPMVGSATGGNQAKLPVMFDWKQTLGLFLW